MSTFQPFEVGSLVTWERSTSSEPVYGLVIERRRNSPWASPYEGPFGGPYNYLVVWQRTGVMRWHSCTFLSIAKETND